MLVGRSRAGRKEKMQYFRYHNTNCFFIESNNSNKLLAIDAGWPSTLREYQRSLKEIGLRFDNLAWAMVTHFHMDHAGLITDFIDNGIECYIFENQVNGIEDMEKTIRKNDKAYKAIKKDKLKVVRINESRGILKNLGIDGEAIVTGSHSNDSVTFILDTHEAIIGDLVPREQIMEDDKEIQNSWKKIVDKGVKQIYPSHSKIFEI
jgi:endoribonuclease LACTB2